MFTGLIEEVGEVIEIRKTPSGGVLKVRTSLGGIEKGDSIAVNGACLTVVEAKNETLTFEVSPETLSRTNLGQLKGGDPVNLERALQAGSRLGGHLVLGHVDFTARILSFERKGNHRELLLEIPSRWEVYFVEKGSVAVDGISLTVNRILSGILSVNIIPYTYSRTNLKRRRRGDLVNIETDIIGKYVLRYLSRREKNLEQALEDLLGS
jgi:riboflavin synthase